MKVIIEYILAAIKALFAMFGKEFDLIEDGTMENVESMLGGLGGYEPEV